MRAARARSASRSSSSAAGVAGALPLPSGAMLPVMMPAAPPPRDGRPNQRWPAPRQTTWVSAYTGAAARAAPPGSAIQPSPVAEGSGGQQRGPRARTGGNLGHDAVHLLVGFCLDIVRLHRVHRVRHHVLDDASLPRRFGAATLQAAGGHRTVSAAPGTAAVLPRPPVGSQASLPWSSRWPAFPCSRECRKP